MRPRFLVLVLAGALVAGCADGSPDKRADEAPDERVKSKPAARDAPANTTESDSPRDRGRDLAWLRRLNRWQINLERDGMTVAATGRGVDNGKRRRRDLRAPLRDLAGCERRLLRRVGEPAADRYRPGYDLLLLGCQSVKRIALQLTRAIDKRERVPMAEVNEESEKSAAYFKRGSAKLEGSMRANRDLSVGSGGRDESKIEPRLSGYASQLVLRKAKGIEVRCWSVEEWPFVLKEWGVYIGRADLLGFVHGRLPRTSLAPSVCRQLAEFVYRGERPTSGLPFLKTADSVGILAHEAEHIRNIRGDEATTECHGMQNLRRLARIMGASESYADLLAGAYWRDLYALNPPEYRTEACRDGGPLDLRRGSDVWP